MGLLTILKKLREEEREMRILMLGLDGAGKTTVVRKLLHKDVNVIEVTIKFCALFYIIYLLNLKLLSRIKVFSD